MLFGHQDAPKPGKHAAPSDGSEPAVGLEEHREEHDDAEPSAAPALTRSLVAGLDGAPVDYDDGKAWLRAGLRRHRPAVIVALILGWTGVWLALWGAAGGAVIGSFIALGVVTSSTAGQHLFNLGAGQGVTAVSVIAGFFLGLAGGFLFILYTLFVTHPWSPFVSVACGVIIAVVTMLIVAAFERTSIRLRGYRRLSRDEVRRVAPLVKRVADAMELEGLPRFAMDDSLIPNAWTHMRTVVLSTGLLQMLDDAELTAVLAHELHHWRSGDVVGLRIMWAAALPIAFILNLGMWIAGQTSLRVTSAGSTMPMIQVKPKGILVVIGWAIAWPAWIMTRLIIVPVSASTQRKYEYQADQAAAEIGNAAALSSALRKMGAFEGGRTGWERAMVATHPPTELRLEALQVPRTDDAEYQESELTGPSWHEVTRMLRGLR